jgi:hypothetical protein
MKLKLSLITLLFIYGLSFGQKLSLTEDCEVSVLTFGPGESLNDAFGHNAFRIKDKNRGIDVVYGYGEYDFDTPNFYLKFARGKLNYLISRHNFSDIYYHYSSFNRSIDEQVLNFSSEEKQKLFDFLENNYKPENRRYLYDFFYDNCATKIRDVAENTTSSNITFKLPVDFEQKTFRQLIREHLNQNSWGSLGIDVALGSVIDRNASAKDYMFLPKYIHSFFNVAKIGNDKNLVKRSSRLFEKTTKNSSTNFLFSPLLVLGLVALFIIYITYRDSKNNKRSLWLDVTLFSVTGIIGILLLLLWFATDHTATGYNYNLLWAMPLNVFVIAQLYRKRIKNWFKGYLKFLVIILCLLTLHWIVGVQIFAIGLIPLLIALCIRYIYLIRYYDTI